LTSTTSAGTCRQQPRAVGERGRGEHRRLGPHDPAVRQRELGGTRRAIDLGESVAQAAVRETLEESGIEWKVTGIAGIYSDPRHVILYTSNGEVRQEFSIVLTARALSGQPTTSSESTEVRWVAAAEVLGYTMGRSMRIRISDFLSPTGSPVVT
jgi:8-oxo-dGTP pyrophosphatase MutT (NUDIX family)